MQDGQSDMQKGRFGVDDATLTSQARQQTVSTSSLQQMAARAGRHYQLVSQSDDPICNAPSETVLNGQVVLQDASETLSVHTTDAVSEKNWTAEIDLPAGLIFCFVAQGSLSFMLESKRFCFNGDVSEGLENAPPKTTPSGNCFLLYLQKPTRLTRFINAGEYVKKLNVTADSAWLNTNGFTSSRQYLPLEHGDIVSWEAEPALRRVALQLLTSSQQADSGRSVKGEALLSDRSPLGSLLLQGLATHCLALAINDGVKQFIPLNSLGTPVSDVQQRLMAIVKRYIHSDSFAGRSECLNAVQPNDALNIKSIASELGMSVSAVQRLAKQTLGDSIVNYIRAKKLDIARKALEQGTMTIGEVAYHAGYKHSSNFAIAFKKAFGIAPGALQGS